MVLAAARPWLSLSLAGVSACNGIVDTPAGPSTDRPAPIGQLASAPESAPLRRLTRFEYNNSVRDLFGDTTQPANALPAEQVGNGFGNDADALSVSSLLAEQYGLVAEGIATRATSTPAALRRLSACTADLTDANESNCTRTVVEALAPRVYRRPLQEGELDSLLDLAKSIRETEGATFATSISAVIQALLQSPDFLYRVEFGAPDDAPAKLRRPTGYEMATRLSYLFWGTLPDDTLLEAAAAGELSTDKGVLEHAQQMLDDARSRPVIRFFFDNLLPINGLADLSRDPTLFPAYNSALGAAMREETLQFLEYEIFQGQGSWPSALTAPYTFVNDALATAYGIPGVSGSEFRKVPLPRTDQRIGVLLQAGVMAGTATTNQSNPVLRGSFVANKLLCLKISLPTDPELLAMVQVPDETSGATARERFSKHSSQPVCAACHRQLDPIGFALENFDPMGQYRSDENGVAIDPSGEMPGSLGTIAGPVELVQKLASSEAAQTCFASHWMDFAYGRTLGRSEAPTQAAVQLAFRQSGYNVRQLLLSLTQTDAFLYLPNQ